MKYKYLPFITGSTVLLLMVALFEMLAFRKTGGHFSYPLDDTFIHMSVAKNIALHHTWGISQYEWVSTSSSPLFTCLMALLFMIFGVSIFVPFAISLAGGLATVYVLNREYNKHSTLTPVQQIISILLIVVIAALPSLSLSGMEHTLQIAVTLVFINRAAGFLEKGKVPGVSFWLLGLLGAIMIGIRYENIFVVLVVCGILFLQKRYGKSILLGFLVVLPIILFGLFFYLKGGYPIPNSVLLKGNNRYSTFLAGYDAISSLSGSIGGMLIIACILAFNKIRKNVQDRDFYLLAIFIVTTLFHSLFGKFGWFFRYEAYLIVFGMFLLLKILFEQFDWKTWRQPSNLIIGSFFFIFCCNLGLRSLNAIWRTPGALHNIYDQQMQLGRFVKEHYDGATIAANDVGAMSFYGNIKMIDMIGLASNEVTRAHLKKYYNMDFLKELVKKNKVNVAIIYETWFKEDLYKDWIKVATWQLPYNVIAGDDLVSFYAMDEAGAAELKEKLLKFEKELPRENKVEYFK
jgi:hypothetical protein